MRDPLLCSVQVGADMGGTTGAPHMRTYAGLGTVYAGLSDEEVEVRMQLVSFLLSFPDIPMHSPGQAVSFRRTGAGLTPDAVRSCVGWIEGSCGPGGREG